MCEWERQKLSNVSTSLTSPTKSTDSKQEIRKRILQSRLAGRDNRKTKEHMVATGAERKGLKRKELSWSWRPTPEKLGETSSGEHPLSFAMSLGRRATYQGWLHNFQGSVQNEYASRPGAAKSVSSSCPNTCWARSPQGIASPGEMS